MLLGCGSIVGGVGRYCGWWETEPMMPSAAWDAPVHHGRRYPHGEDLE